MAFSEREVVQTGMFEAMQFAVKLDPANRWPGIQEFESWWSRNANDAKKAKTEERRQICCDQAIKYKDGGGTSIRQAIIHARKFIVDKNSLRKFHRMAR